MPGLYIIRFWSVPWRKLMSGTPYPTLHSLKLRNRERGLWFTLSDQVFWVHPTQGCVPFIWLQGFAIGRKKYPWLISHLSSITFLFSNYKNPSIWEETAGFHSTGWNNPWRQDLWILTSALLCHLLWSPDPVLTAWIGLHQLQDFQTLLPYESGKNKVLCAG